MTLKVLAGAFAALISFASHATDLSVNPVVLELGPNHNSSLLTVSNGSKEQVRFQVKAYTWSVSEDGELKTAPAPSSDISVFPPMFAVDASSSRNVRVTVKLPPGAAEATWRVFVEELPTPHDVAVERAGASVQVRTRIGVPVFLAPTSSGAPAVHVNRVTFEKGKAIVQIENAGTKRALISNAELSWTTTAGVQHAATPGWYLLPGAKRNLTVAREKGACPSPKARIAVTVDVEGLPAVHEAVAPTEPCAD